jgi:capsular polysaccharide biosynthesis protein
MSTATDEHRTVAAPPPTVSVVRAMLWHWWIVAVSVIVCAGLGAAYGLLRAPEYTAAARMTVGRIDISSPGALSGYSTATSSLAIGYSRTVTALAVAKRVASENGMSAKEVRSQVSATPVPESPIFKIEASSSDRKQAISLANDSSRALIDFSAKLSRSNPDSARLYLEYGRAVAKSKAAQKHVGSVSAAIGAHPTPSQEAELEAARGASKAAALRATAIGQAYTTSVHDQAATRLIQVVSPAIEADSDRRSVFTIAVFIGLVIGLLAGAGIAYYRESRFQPGAAAAA